MESNRKAFQNNHLKIIFVLSNGSFMEHLVPIEENMRLSKSLLWDLQCAAYCQFGPEAWSRQGVPSYVTSNPYTSLKYAHVALGYIRDCIKPDSVTPIDITQPLYILDLGAGTGRFGYLFLKTLLSLLQPHGLNELKIRYVMTDIAEKNIDFCRTHPYLKPFIESGILDFSIYHHADQNKPLELIISKEKITKENLVNPLILIANYFFDTIPQDLFRLNKGKLEEGRISISVEVADELQEINATNPKIIPQMRCSYSYKPIKDPNNYYKSFQLLNKLLKGYSEQFDNIPFLFPVGAFHSMQFFSEISKGRMCLLAGDQGVCTAEQVKEWGEPKIARHGTFSIPVSYHAISDFFIKQKGIGLLTSFPDPQFVVMAGILGGAQLQYPELQLAFNFNFDLFEPCDYWKLVNCAEKETSSLSLEYIFLLLKLGNWDPMVFNSFYNQIRQQLTKCSNEMKQQLKTVIINVWQNYYPVGSDGGNFVMNLGVLLFELQDYNQALACFKQALNMLGKQPQILQNIAVCMKALEAN